MKRFVLWIALILACALTNAQEFSIQHNGLTRTYRLHLPAEYTPDTLYPLVINMHGLGSNAWEQEIYSEFNNVSDTGNFIVAYPNGVNETWNVSSPAGVDDVGFISALIDTLDMLYGVNLQRVYSTGMSMGGFMSYRLACELSSRIAAIASVTGLQAFYPCEPSRPVPVLQIHGTADPVVPYVGVATTISNWTAYNSCPDMPPVITDLPDIDTTDGCTVTVSNYGICSDSSEVILYTINGGEHTWPGSPITIGITCNDIQASNEIWGFFSRHQLPETTGTDEYMPSTDLKFSFYPNPLSNYGTIDLLQYPNQDYDAFLLDIHGQIIWKKLGLREQRFLLNCSDIPSGVYILRILMADKSLQGRVIVR